MFPISWEWFSTTFGRHLNTLYTHHINEIFTSFRCLVLASTNRNGVMCCVSNFKGQTNVCIWRKWNQRLTGQIYTRRSEGNVFVCFANKQIQLSPRKNCLLYGLFKQLKSPTDTINFIRNKKKIQLDETFMLFFQQFISSPEGTKNKKRHTHTTAMNYEIK